MKSNTRYIATQALHRVLTEEQSLNQVLPPLLGRLPEKEQPLLQELCFGVCRNLHQMQFWLKHLLNRPLKTKDHDILALLYLGIYQLLFTRIPDHAAIGETVGVVDLMQKPWAKGLVNGILRNVQRQQNQPPEAWLADPIYCYSHPKWFIKALQEAWPDHWQDILNANNHKPPMTIRVNSRQYSADAYLSLLQDDNIDALITPFSSVGLTLSKPVSVEQLPCFQLGSASVQDEAAQLAAELLQLEPNQRVLDACCAPGGKTSHILESCPDIAELWSLDDSADRMELVKQNLQRLQLKAMLKVGDATQVNRWWDGKPFERILIDAPCSATGVVRRHPDIKLLRRKDDIASLSELQIKILQSLWQVLAPGGILVYATCSVMPQENEQVIEQFVHQQSDAKHDVIQAQWGLERPFGRQLFPRHDGHDGFYYARLIKV